MVQKVAKADAGDYSFELHKKENGEFACFRSDVSDPTQNLEEVTDIQQIPPQVFSIFRNCMQ